ncbi:MAG: bifunctional diguanylate cyclase/phosphodiesterase [Neomegalonema sp.]|nr:bifunctional diguanylate cyclase/phosphodiesterase [Neomegalonema sp.]
MPSSASDPMMPAPQAQTDTAERLRRRLARERAAREQAERLLEDKSRALYLANEQLRQINDELAETLADARSATELNRRLALYDPLTDLGNRRLLFDWLNQAIAALKHCDHCTLVLLHIDLDRFKQVNDTMGHVAGDTVLCEVARRLLALVDDAVARDVFCGSCGRDPIVARVGGDEFVIAGFAKGAMSSALKNLTPWTGRVNEALRLVPSENGKSARLGASIGVTLRDQAGPPSSPGDLLAEADLALYQSKSAGGDRLGFFDQPLRDRAQARHRLRNALMQALENDEFIPVYQPQVCATSHEIIGAEALVRWRRPNGDILPPGAFLDFAGELGLLSAIDRAICTKAVADLQRWRKAGLCLPKLSVNVSAGRLADPDLLSGLADATGREGLTFELLESMVLDDTDPHTCRVLQSILEAGIAIEIDDFGSGHASILALMRLRPSRIKLDRALIRPLSSSADHRMVVSTLVRMAYGLDIKVTAEGVETSEQAALLSNMGCDTLQGFAFSRPVPRETFTDMLAARVLSAQA